jgi:ankyrin repeat protein
MSASGKDAVNAMLRAAEKGDVEAVRAAIGDGVDVLAVDGARNTALHLAAYRGHPEVCRALLASKADPTLGNENKDLPSHLAALASRIDCLEVLFEPSLTSFKVDVEAHDSQGYCALHYACGEGHLDVARFLIEKCNADLDSRNNDGLTPIMCAVQQGHKNVASVLLAANPQSIAATNNSGDTCLHYATISEGGVSMLEMLLRNGADPYVKNKDGLTPLHEAVIEKQVRKSFAVCALARPAHGKWARTREPASRLLLWNGAV